MHELNQSERDCLVKIAQGRPAIDSPCADQNIGRLLSLGFIEKVPRIWLPLEMLKTSYQVTPAGRGALQKR